MKLLRSKVVRTLLIAFTASLQLSDPQRLHAQHSELLFVENTLGGTVSIIDVAARSVVGSIAVGRFPDDIIASNKGDVLYVNRMPVRSEDGRPPVPGEIIAIDPITRQVSWRMWVGGEPHHLAISPDDRRLYVPIWDSNHLEIVDLEKRAVVDSVPVGYGPHTTVLGADGRTVYVGTIHQQHITIFDGVSGVVSKTIPMGEGVRPFAVSRDQKTMYVQLSRLHGFQVVDVASGTITQTVHLPPVADASRLPKAWPYSTNHGIGISPDQRFLVAAATAGDFVAIYALPQLTLLGTVPTGREPNWVIFSRDGRSAYVSNRKSNDVSIIALDSRTETARIQVGDYPQRMATVLAPAAASAPAAREERP